MKNPPPRHLSSALRTPGALAAASRPAAPPLLCRLAAAAALCAALVLGGCGAGQAPFSEEADPPAPAPAPAEPTQPAEPPSAPTPEELLEQRVDATMASMTQEQKVAQLFIVTPEAITGVETATQAGDTTRAALASYPVGGLVYFQKNLLNPEQTAQMLANSQAYAREVVDAPLFCCVDEEGGTVSRIGGNSGFDVENVGNMADVGATGDQEKAQSTAETIAGYLSQLGFNVDFAPDADVADNPESNVMALRSFGADPSLVASMVAAQVDGFSAKGVLCTAKHFPGIGAAVGDSHDGSIGSDKTLDQLKEVELVPFKAAIEHDVPFVMVGHLSLPNVTGSDVPASLSPDIVTGVLRERLGYQNVVVTDSLGMGAVSAWCAPDQVAVEALLAGADMVLMPADFQAAYQGALDALADGRLTQDRIDDSVRRILTMKYARLD